MSMLNNSLLLGQEGGAGYVVERSLRFSSSDSAFLSRTPASAGNRKTWTWAGWVKRSAFGSFQQLFVAADSNYAQNGFDPSDRLRHYPLNNGSAAITTTAVFRDPSAWYHIVYYTDTTAANASDRLRIYVNGVLQQVTGTYPAQNTDLAFNQAIAHNIGRYWSGSEYLDGYLADVHFIDGQALTPSSFAETNATTGQWVPKAYTGTYGTNGFKLSFSNNASTTTISQDSSGNNNHWTANNISVTAGAGNDSLVDTPTSYGTDTGAGGEVRGNYCTLNPLAANTATLPTNGNLEYGNNATTDSAVVGTIGLSSGKWYWEFTAASTYASVGFTKLSRLPASIQPTTANSQALVYRGDTGQKVNNGSAAAYGATYVSGDIVGIALDLDAGTLAFYKNGVSQGTAFSGISGTYLPVIGCPNGWNSGTCNFGQRPFAYTAPSGFKALCDTNLPAPVVAKPNTVMDVLTWTGNGGGSRSFTGLNFSPDLAWVKTRSVGYTHVLWDSVRGAGVSKELQSDSTNAEGGASTNNSGYLSSFNSDGFSSTAGSTDNDYFNRSATTYVAWAWDAGSSTVTNTQGSITSQVRANASAGFSIVTWTSPGLSSPNTGTVGHGLGVKPALIIHKRRSAADPWPTYHSSFGVSTIPELLALNSTGIPGPDQSIVPAQPTSSVFSVGWSNQTGGTAGNSLVAYCFAPVAGYSSFGSYTGNGSTDGPFVYTGFRPRWVMIKATGGSTGNENWMIKDALRPAYNPTDGNLYANQSFAEDSTSTVFIDLVSNGFKIRGTYAGVNTSAVTYIYAAFAENPFQYARAR